MSFVCTSSLSTQQTKFWPIKSVSQLVQKFIFLKIRYIQLTIWFWLIQHECSVFSKCPSFSPFFFFFSWYSGSVVFLRNFKYRRDFVLNGNLVKSACILNNWLQKFLKLRFVSLFFWVSFVYWFLLASN